jgi:hypothetical protein
MIRSLGENKPKKKGSIGIQHQNLRDMICGYRKDYPSSLLNWFCVLHTFWFWISVSNLTSSVVMIRSLGENKPKKKRFHRNSTPELEGYDLRLQEGLECGGARISEIVGF